MDRPGVKGDRPASPRTGKLYIGTTVYLNINNHYEGSAPLTIQKVLPMLSGASSP